MGEKKDGSLVVCFCIRGTLVFYIFWICGLPPSRQQVSVSIFFVCLFFSAVWNAVFFFLCWMQVGGCD